MLETGARKYIVHVHVYKYTKKCNLLWIYKFNIKISPWITFVVILMHVHLGRECAWRVETLDIPCFWGDEHPADSSAKKPWWTQVSTL